MKPKQTILILVALIAGSFIGLAQDNPLVLTNAAPDSAAPTIAAPPDAAPLGAVPADAAPASHDATAVIPLIQYVEVPLTTAIENLARQANLNYILDPKVAFGQPGPDGKPIPQPTISLRWENLTAEQALTALLNNYNLALVEDPKTKIARVTVKDPAAPDPLVTKIIQLKYAGATNMIPAVQATFIDKRSKVVPDVRTSQLVVVATEKEMLAIDELVERIDTQTKQVLIEAKILETTLSPKTRKGIDWAGTFDAQKLSFGNNLRQTTPTESLNNLLSPTSKILLDTAKGFNPSTAFLDADGLNVALSFLNNSADTKVISEPRIVMLDNQKATIDVGLLFPVVNTSAGTANTAGGSSVSYTNLTVNLDVTPRITANNFVELKILQGILRLGPSFTSVVGGFQNQVNSFFTRKSETTVLIPSGNTLVMGGLISDENTSANTKVPLLGDIPGLGLLFRKDSKERNRNNLIIFITPTIVQDSDFQPAHTEFLKSTANENVTEEWSSWDSGKPLDWSKPAFNKDVSFEPRDPTR